MENVLKVTNHIAFIPSGEGNDIGWQSGVFALLPNILQYSLHLLYVNIFVLLADVTSTKNLSSSNNELNTTFNILLNTQHLIEPSNCYLF